MKHSFRILLAAFILIFMALTSVSQAQVQMTYQKIMMVYKGSKPGDIYTSKIGANGEFSFKNVAPDTYQLLIAGNPEYFTAKSADAQNSIEINHFQWGADAVVNPAGGGGSRASINTTRSNIKHPAAIILPPAKLPTITLDGKSCVYQVLADGLIQSVSSTPSGSVSKFAIKENGVK
jgi:hypothetical protein